MSKLKKYFCIFLLALSVIFIQPNYFAEPLDQILNTQDAYDAASRGAEVVFTYNPGNMYRIYCQDGFLTDIRLQPGEDVLFVGAGDTVRWILDKANAGSGANKVTHLYLKPIQRGISTNIIITTSKRSYQIEAIATSFYNPMISWVYPQDEKEALFRQQELEKQKLEEQKLTFRPENLNFNYKLSRKKYSWSPEQVFDDGTKTFIKMKPSMATGDAPVLFVVDKNNNAVLVNYRVVRNYYIVDRLFNKAELRVGNDIVKIEKN